MAPRRLNGYIDRLKRHPRVAIVDDERSIGNGVIVTLKKGFTFDQLSDNRIGGGDTPKDALHAVKMSYTFCGSYDP